MKQPGFVSETTLWLYKVFVYIYVCRIRLLSSFLRTGRGSEMDKQTSTRATVVDSGKSDQGQIV